MCVDELVACVVGITVVVLRFDLRVAIGPPPVVWWPARGAALDIEQIRVVAGLHFERALVALDVQLAGGDAQWCQALSAILQRASGLHPALAAQRAFGCIALLLQQPYAAAGVA